MSFIERYTKLNDNQKLAVDSIDGPVMVIAGPGTGKTELLSVRVANILKKTDTLPENILCLTFTDSGANAMRERLTEIIGKDAYKVAVHTFHSFGTEIINQYGEFFYEGAHFRPADELSSYQILTDIFKKLEHNSPIAKTNNGEFTYLKESKKVISELKKSGLTSDELLAILDENDKAINVIESLISPILEKGVKKNTAEECAKNIQTIRNINEEIIIPTFTQLSVVFADSLESAIDEARIDHPTKPITAWKNKWFIKNSNNKIVLKSHESQIKLRAISEIYDNYLKLMQKSELYDFDDMILRVVHGMEIFDELRFNLQEKYQYIMIDEFQDTNMAQMRVLHNLTNNIVNEGAPNIMVVGDDDQAIYSFQGADISNIIDFRKNFPKTKIITLTDNYRSTENILEGSREIIIQNKNRLEDSVDSINKSLKSHLRCDDQTTQIIATESILDERVWLADKIKSLISLGKKPSDIAVLLRQHKEIDTLLPYLYDRKIAVNYERQNNVLEQKPIILIEQLSRLLINLLNGNHSEVNAMLPEILAHSVWGFNPTDVWDISLKAYSQRKQWLEIMAETEFTRPIYNWIINISQIIPETPLEEILDKIIGKTENNSIQNKFVSPFYNYFFSAEKLDKNPNEYLVYLEALRTIRSKLIEFRPDTIPTLATFIEYIDLNRKIGSTISSIRKTIQTDDAINVMTAHKSKGLEFDTVFIMNAVDSVWGEKARTHNRLISYPENLPLIEAGGSGDERVRLFYVAATRAKNNLYISYNESNDNGKQTYLSSFLVDSQWDKTIIKSDKSAQSMTESTELSWYQTLIEPVSPSMHELLRPTLENYKLSVTHLNNFLDVTSDGPANFLINNLLHFPSAKSPSAAFGTAIHATLQESHDYFIVKGKKQSIDELLLFFEKALKDQRLPKTDFEFFLLKGKDTITNYLSNNHEVFKKSQKTEVNFSNQQCIIDEAHITGKLDLVDIDKDENTISVIDYKTGKPAKKWQGKDEYEKIKLHKYKQQLMFYKLLIENSRDFHKLTVISAMMQFVEQDSNGDILSISTDFSDCDMDNFINLIKSVWKHIKNFDLPDVSKYDKTYKGMLAFESDLIDEINTKA